MTIDDLRDLIAMQADPDYWSLSIDGFRVACRYFMNKSRELEAIIAGSWINGKPTTVGIWVVQYQNQAYQLVEVKEEFDDEMDASKSSKTSYLQASTERFSWPLDNPDSELSRFVLRSFGPIPVRLGGHPELIAE